MEEAEVEEPWEREEDTGKEISLRLAFMVWSPYLRSCESSKHLPCPRACIPKASRDWLPAVDMKTVEIQVRKQSHPAPMVSDPPDLPAPRVCPFPEIASIKRH